MKNEQGSEPLWRRACLWTYCERITVQNIKRYEIKPENQTINVFFKEMIILLYKRKTRKMQIRPVSNFKRVYNIQGLLYVVTTNFGRERA